jgi:hypothetical protein
MGTRTRAAALEKRERRAREEYFIYGDLRARKE